MQPLNNIKLMAQFDKFKPRYPSKLKELGIEFKDLPENEQRKINGFLKAIENLESKIGGLTGGAAKGKRELTTQEVASINEKYADVEIQDDAICDIIDLFSDTDKLSEIAAAKKAAAEAEAKKKADAEAAAQAEKDKAEKEKKDKEEAEAAAKAKEEKEKADAEKAAADKAAQEAKKNEKSPILKDWGFE